MKRYNTLALVTGLLLTSCASIVSGTQQSVFIETPHVNGAECTLTDSKNGSWYLPSTPGSTSVSKGNGPLNIVSSKPGYETTTVSAEETVAGATFGNIILGGGIGIFVDAATGAAQMYPDKIIVWMKPKHFASASERKSWENSKAEYERKLKEEIEAKRKAQQDNNSNLNQ